MPEHTSHTELRAGTSALLALFALGMALASSGCHETTSTSAGVRERWYQRQRGFGYTRPAISGTHVFFGTGDGEVIAREQQTGTAVWATKIANESIGGANMVVRGAVLVVPVVHETVALDAITGQEKWRYSAPLDTIAGRGGISEPGLVFRTHIDADDQTVYIPAWGASISAVDVGTGAVRWIWQSNATASDTAAGGTFRSGSGGVRVSGDTVYATVWHSLDASGLAAESWLVALDRNTGRELWRTVMAPAGSSALVLGAPVVAGDLVIFQVTGGREYAINRLTTQLAWEYTPHTTNATDAETELYDGIVYHDGGDQYIYALHAVDGSVVWRAPFSSMTSDDMLVTSRRVIFSDGGTLYVLDRATGRQLVRVEQPRTSDSFFASPPAYANGQVFVTVGDGAWSFDEP